MKESVPDISIFERVCADQPDVTFKEKDMLLRDNEQNTPLSYCLRAATHNNSLSALLEANAASSVFVKGYTPGSLICTLPMAVQPPSSVFDHPPPMHVSPEVISQLDAQLAQHVTHLHTRKVNQQFDIDRKEHLLKALYPDPTTLEHRLLSLLLQTPDATAVGSMLSSRYEKEYGESLPVGQLKDLLLSTHTVKTIDMEGNRAFCFTFLRNTERCLFVPSGESVIVLAVVPTDCTEYMVQFDTGTQKQVALENLRPLRAAPKKAPTPAVHVPFSHPGCAASRSCSQPGNSNNNSSPFGQGGGAGFGGTGSRATSQCTACGGWYVNCGGSYGSRNRAGRWVSGVCQDPGDCPESPNDHFCSALCEQHGAEPSAPAVTPSPSSAAGAGGAVGKARLQVGDKVMLSPTGDVGVIAESESDSDASQQVYWFRGSWLQRVSLRPDPGRKSSFLVGDRVQLNPAQWAFTAESHRKKCLGKPSDASFGRVVSTGVAQKDGSQRNMEVSEWVDE